MQIQQYYKKIDARAHILFEATLKKPDLLARVHAAASEIDQLAALLPDEEERKMLRTVCAQLETSSLCTTRQWRHYACAWS